MSCLTRKLQQKLVKYIQKNMQDCISKEADEVREELVSKGICPSDVTTDQMRQILQYAS